jgi:hypothetical protein
MANDATRLTTADLRRRLTGTGAPAEPANPAPAPAPPRPAARPLIPAAMADIPVEEDGSTVPIVNLTDEAPPIAEAVEPTPVPVARLTPPELRRPDPVPVRRPEGRSSAAQARPILPPGAERPMLPLAAERPTGRSSHSQSRSAIQAAMVRPEGTGSRYGEPAPAESDPIVELLRQENTQLQQLMGEMRQLLQEASDQEQKVHGELADRDQKLAAAQARITELETIVNNKPKTKTELEEWADELERESFQIAQERRTFDEDRKQLRDDEAALEKQMRDMEVQMARERALLARQEQELKRLNAEIQHELELMQRGDGVLRERLQVFQRRHAEVVSGESPQVGTSYFGGTQSPVAAGATRKSDPGLLRRMFRPGSEPG